MNTKTKHNKKKLEFTSFFSLNESNKLHVQKGNQKSLFSFQNFSKRIGISQQEVEVNSNFISSNILQISFACAS